jgi:Flp pilus assembly protein TadB
LITRKEAIIIETAYAAGLFGAAAAGLFFYSFKKVPFRKARRELNATEGFYQVVRAFGPLVTVIYPEAVRQEAEKKFIWAGLKNMDASEFLAIKLTAASLFSALMLLLVVSGKNALPAVLLAFLGYMFPDLWLGRKIQERQKLIRTDVPEFAALLATVLEAGGGNIQSRKNLLCGHQQADQYGHIHV